jgi:L-threonylcarbamoyladenylate synthase
MKIFKIEPHHIDHSLIRTAADILRAGGLVIFPTDTLYGLAANIYNDVALKRVFEVKKRPLNKPLPVLISDPGELSSLAQQIPPLAKTLMDFFWPGSLTLVFKKTAKVSAILTGGKGTVAVRVPDHPVTLALIREASFPVTGPSANISGMEPPVTAEEAARNLGEKVDLVIDAGPCPIRTPSTILDLTGSKPQILREGAIPRQILETYVEADL